MRLLFLALFFVSSPACWAQDGVSWNEFREKTSMIQAKLDGRKASEVNELEKEEASKKVNTVSQLFLDQLEFGPKVVQLRFNF